MAGRPQAERALGSWEGMQSREARRVNKVIIIINIGCGFGQTSYYHAHFTVWGMRAQRGTGACQETQPPPNPKQLGRDARFIWSAWVQGHSWAPISMQATLGAAPPTAQSQAGNMTSAGEQGEGRPSLQRQTPGPPACPCRGRRGWVGQSGPAGSPACLGTPGLGGEALALLPLGCGCFWYGTICPGRLLI